MAKLWVVDSNCFIHIGSMAPDTFVKDISNVLESLGTGLHVTPGVHDEVKTVDFKDGKDNRICWKKCKVYFSLFLLMIHKSAVLQI